MFVVGALGCADVVSELPADATADASPPKESPTTDSGIVSLGPDIVTPPDASPAELPPPLEARPDVSRVEVTADTSPSETGTSDAGPSRDGGGDAPVGDVEGPPEGFRALFTTLLAPTCGQGRCHVSTAPGALTFTDAASTYAQLINHPVRPGCLYAHPLRVVPFEPERSAMTQIDEDLCGHRHGAQRAFLRRPGDTAQIAAWIRAGAR